MIKGELVPEKHPFGRPPVDIERPVGDIRMKSRLFQDPSELVELAGKYFDLMKPKFWTITGFCNFAGIVRATFYEYEQRPEFKEVIQRIRQTVEAAGEHRLIERGNAGDIFWLKNHGWKDTVEHTQTVQPIINIGVIDLDTQKNNAPVPPVEIDVVDS